MTTRHQLPGGQWAEVLGPENLSGGDQDAFLDEFDRLIEDVPRPEPKPDPANPAVMLPAPPRTLGRAGNRALEDWIWARVIKAWSFGELPLPWRPEYRTAMGPDSEPVLSLPVLNALRKAAQPAQNALTDSEEQDDGAPKSGLPGGSGGSEGTSKEGTQSPLPAPPAVPSGTP